MENNVKSDFSLTISLSNNNSMSFKTETKKEMPSSTTGMFPNITKVKSEPNEAFCSDNITKEEFLVDVEVEDAYGEYPHTQITHIEETSNEHEATSSKDMCDSPGEVPKDSPGSVDVDETNNVSDPENELKEHRRIKKRSSRMCLFEDCCSSNDCTEHSGAEEPLKQLMHDDESLPEGWSRTVVQRQNGKSAGKYDVYIKSPEGKRFRSYPELRSYLTRIHSHLRADDFNFSVTGNMKLKTKHKKGKQPKKSETQGSVKIKRRRSSSKELPDGSCGSSWTIFPLSGFNDAEMHSQTGPETEMYHNGIYEPETEIIELPVIEPGMCTAEIIELQDSDNHSQLPNSGEDDEDVQVLTGNKSSDGNYGSQIASRNGTDTNKNSQLVGKPIRRRRGRKSKCQSCPVETVKTESRKNLTQEKVDLTDEDQLFLQSILPSIKSLPRPRKLYIRYKIQELLYNESV